MIPVLGIDVGNVIVDGHGSADTSFFGGRFLETPEVTGAIAAISRLMHGRFGGRGHVVSKCGSNVEAKTRAWLKSKGFTTRTGIGEDAWHFVRRREDKAPVCARLGVTHFVDDRLEVLSHMATVPVRILFRPSEREVQKFAQHLSGVLRVENWDDVVRLCHPVAAP